MVDKIFAATKAFIVNKKGEVLIVRESSNYQDGSKAGLFDVVGGRVNPGERFDDSLRREIKEETNLEVEIGNPFCVNEWRPKIREEEWQIIATFFECTTQQERVTLSKDHDMYKWIDPTTFKEHNIITTNLPAFEAFLKRRNL